MFDLLHFNVGFPPFEPVVPHSVVPLLIKVLLPFAFVSIVAFFIVAVEFFVTSIPEFSP